MFHQAFLAEAQCPQVPLPQVLPTQTCVQALGAIAVFLESCQWSPIFPLVRILISELLSY